MSGAFFMGGHMYQAIVFDAYGTLFDRGADAIWMPQGLGTDGGMN